MTTLTMASDCRGGTLLNSLKSWLPEYTAQRMLPPVYPGRAPVFSARLGQHQRIRRSDSSESISTQLSLLSCSTYGHKSGPQPQTSRQRRQTPRVKTADVKTADVKTADVKTADVKTADVKTADVKTADVKTARPAEPSLWVQLASRRRGALDKMLKMDAVNAQLETESEIFQCLAEDEKQLVIKAAARKLQVMGRLGGRRNSEPSQRQITRIHIRRPASADTHSQITVNLTEFRSQLASLRENQLRKSTSRTRSNVKPNGGSNSAPLTRVQSQHSNEATHLTTQSDTVTHHESTAVWNQDFQDFNFDSKKEFTSKVRNNIHKRTLALTRVTGLGDYNRLRAFAHARDEDPHAIKQDYTRVVRFPYRMRISPQLSDVIKVDIMTRMGRPRYHEIRIRDLELWNQGHFLDRSHRNLKVFNWLQSLQEGELDLSGTQTTIDDSPHDVSLLSVNMESVDEPRSTSLAQRSTSLSPRSTSARPLDKVHI